VTKASNQYTGQARDSVSGDRRSFLSRLVVAGGALIGAGMAGLAGLVAAPRKPGGEGRWRMAIAPGHTPASFPHTAVLTERHEDGWYETTRQTVVFIDKQGDQLTAMSATCSHLGCHVRWDAGTNHFKCPCHGGTYDRGGNVVSGPPPRPLDKLQVRVNPKTSAVEIEL
jgi:nitrite reductase/ring-hydroxylating ferredoxin subunit